MIARRLCVWAQSAQGSRGFPEKSLRVAPRLALLLISGAVLWALREQPSAQSGTGRTLQHGSSQCRRWPDDVATGLCRDSPRCPPARAAIAGGPWTSHRYGGKPISAVALMPNNNVPTRKPRRPEPAKYLRHNRSRDTAACRIAGNGRPTPRHLPMKPSLRTARTVNFSSSMPPWIGEQRRLTGSSSGVALCHPGGNDHPCSSHVRNSL